MSAATGLLGAAVRACKYLGRRFACMHTSRQCEGTYLSLQDSTNTLTQPSAFLSALSWSKTLPLTVRQAPTPETGPRLVIKEGRIVLVKVPAGVQVDAAHQQLQRLSILSQTSN